MQKRSKKTKLIMGIVLVALLGGGMYLIPNLAVQSKTAATKGETQKTTVVSRRSITSELSSSGTISPKDTYEITSLVEGEVIAADFEEGDLVERGQVLYQMDVSSMESELTSARNTLNRAQESYQVASADYQEMSSKYSGNSYKSTEAGYIKTLYVKAGDKVGANTKIADIYNDQIMKLKVPFLSTEAGAIAPGQEGVVTLTDTGEQLSCTVYVVSNMDVTLTGGRIVRYVTVQVPNPGGLTTSHAATVRIGEIDCSVEATFEPMIETVMNADMSSNAEIEALLVNEGDLIQKGTPLFRLDAKSVEKMIRSYQDSVANAEEKIESAQNSIDNKQDTYESYTITAPISGQVITKTTKTGDNISKSSSGAMAVIFDLSSVTFEMSVDELDVRSVKVGQKVEITADAIEGTTFTGEVTNVSLQSSYANGVTNYPVTVTLDEVGELLPGMNVEGRIVLSEATDTLSVPVDALMRGNRVYIKDESVTEAEGNVPAGFRAVEVTTGLISDDYVELLEGVSEGDEVYVAASSTNQSSVSFQMEMQGAMPAGGAQGRPSGGGAMPAGGNRDSGSNQGSR